MEQYIESTTKRTRVSSTDYDYIIAGAGCAGLSLVVHMIESGKFADKKILIVDKDAKMANDRTWCFWEQSPGLFEPVVYKKWNQLMVHSDEAPQLLSIQPYQYKLIRGIDFYAYCLEKIARHSQIEFLQGNIQAVNVEETSITVGGKKFTAGYVFNSIYEQPVLRSKEYWMLQHFKGWVVEAVSDVFDPAKATLMDFRTSQEAGTSFFYVLPFSSTKALIEYTVFSPQLLQQHAYDGALKHYVVNQLNISDYSILDEEFGVIPMTNALFRKKEKNVINIGTAGGQTKGSSGYTFRFIQKHSAALVNSIVKHGHPLAVNAAGKRFHFYDSILLDVLYHRRLEGADIFNTLFRKNDPRRVLKFLDNETTLAEDIFLIATLPTLPFTKAALSQFFY